MQGGSSFTNSSGTNSTGTITIRKSMKIEKLGKIVSASKNNDEVDPQFIEQINRINSSNITVDQSRTADLDDNQKEKKKEKVKFSLLDLEQLHSLGSGASGEVFLLQHKVKKKYFACKVIPLKKEEKSRILIETEVKVHHECRCPYLIRCHATYYNQGAIHIVLEYMNRGTLSDILKKMGKIPEEMLGLITLQTLKGIQYLNEEKNIIHRDIKPSNILLNSEGCVKISDFGVSRYLPNDPLNQMSLIGTYIYMSPEKLEGKFYNFNSDIWSIGLSLLECAIGYYPYLIYNDFKPIPDIWTLSNIMAQNESPKLPVSDYSSEFCDFIDACLCKDPSVRPSASTLLKHPFVLLYENQHKSILAKWLSQMK